MIKRFLSWFFSDQDPITQKYKIICMSDDETHYSLAEMLSKIEDKILLIQQELEELRSENIELTNSIYECENRLESRIDSIHPVVYNIRNKSED